MNVCASCFNTNTNFFFLGGGMGGIAALSLLQQRLHTSCTQPPKQTWRDSAWSVIHAQTEPKYLLVCVRAFVLVGEAIVLRLFSISLCALLIFSAGPQRRILDNYCRLMF